MARYKGRVIVKKVDAKGKIISNYVSWRKKHPKEKVFDSKTEWSVWNYVKKHVKGITFIEQPQLILFDSLKTTEFIKSTIKPATIRNIKYTPDFYIQEYDVYIEVKGYADPLFKLRWKLFKNKGYTGYIVYSLDEFKILINELQQKYTK